MFWAGLMMYGFLVRNAGALFRRGDEVVITQWTRRVSGRAFRGIREVASWPI